MRSRSSARGCFPVTVDVVPDSALPVALELLTPRRGRIVLGRITLSSDYPLGLWQGWAYVHFPLAGIAFPDARSRARRRFRPALPDRTISATSRSDHGDLAGLRAYQPGDPMQRVAWKAVARGIGWHTKQFEGGGGGGPVHLNWDALPPKPRPEGAHREVDRMGARRRARGAAVPPDRAGHRARRRGRDAIIGAPRSPRSR